jgi:hypothetical protein
MDLFIGAVCVAVIAWWLAGKLGKPDDYGE